VRAGHCIHDLFEHLDFREAQGPVLEHESHSALTRHGIEDHWTPTLVELVARVLDTRLTSDGLRLRRVGPEDRLNELEFHFALEGFRPRAVHQVLADHGVPAWAAPPAESASGCLEGLMKGFMDLVLRHDGRFYVLDYKSNHLGDRTDDYGPDQVAQAMRGHQYHLQSLIYTLALHRYLKSRLPGYEPGQHLGGSLYLFLRGIRPEWGPDRGVFHERPSQGLIEDLDQVFGTAGRP
jgi:exodeoxyribonuclease V beta subunit